MKDGSKKGEKGIKDRREKEKGIKKSEKNLTIKKSDKESK